jgi:hypothetical protein
VLYGPSAGPVTRFTPFLTQNLLGGDSSEWADYLGAPLSTPHM